MTTTNEFVEKKVEELETLEGTDYQTDYYPVSKDWLRTAFAEIYAEGVQQGCLKGERRRVLVQIREEAKTEGAREERHAWLDGARCLTCGIEKASEPLSDTCVDCLETA